MKKQFTHRCLEVMKDRKLIYTSFSKHLAYFKDHISKFVIEKGHAPLNPFSIPYFMLDTLPRDVCREVNNNLLKRSDEVWVFGKVSDGVLAEVKIAKQLGKNIKYFKVVDSKEIKEIKKDEVEFEDDVKELAGEILD
ncbi:MAG: hypothetical protein ACP5O8_03695 [Candidatus Aenigmatarchaeota archaeon]